MDFVVFIICNYNFIIRKTIPFFVDDAGGMLLLELNRVLRPGGFFVWSATPVYQTLEEDVEIWKGKVIIGEKHNMFNKQATTKLMCYFFLQKCLL